VASSVTSSALTSAQSPELASSRLPEGRQSILAASKHCDGTTSSPQPSPPDPFRTVADRFKPVSLWWNRRSCLFAPLSGRPATTVLASMLASAGASAGCGLPPPVFDQRTDRVVTESHTDARPPSLCDHILRLPAVGTYGL